MAGPDLDPATVARLGLGGAQFGLDYGVTNPVGRVPQEQIERIFTRAVGAGMGWVDTAPEYGDSERAIGLAGFASSSLRVVTKTANLSRTPEGGAAAHIQAGVAESLRRLRRERLDVLLIHHVSDLLRADAGDLVAVLHDLKTSGRVGRIGISIYDRSEFETAAAKLAPDVVQLPMSLLDQRPVVSGLLGELGRRRIAVHVRSVFLQGLLIADPAAVPLRMARWRGALAAFRAAVLAKGWEAEGACLRFALAWPEVEAVIVGITGSTQLDALIASLARTPAVDPSDAASLASEDPVLVDPRQWPRTG